MRNFDNYIDAYLKFTEGHEASPLIHKWAIISVIAASLERKVSLDRGFYTLFPNLYVFIIGKSGLIKKSTSTGIAVGLFRELTTGRMMSERLTAAALIEQLVYSQKKYEHAGKMYKQSALFAYASELSIFLGEVYGSITELLTSFYDGAPYDCDHAWTHSTRQSKDAPMNIYGPCLNILGASTKTWLKKCIPKSEMEGGFTSRIIFVVENRIPEKLIAWPELDATLTAHRLMLVEDLKTIHSLKGQFRVHPKAKDLFTEWYENHMRNIVPLNQDPKIAGYMARKGDTILKLAMVRRASQDDTLEILPQDVLWGAQELDLLEPEWRNAFDSMTTKGEIGFEIKQYIRARGKIRKKELLTVFGGQYPAEEVSKEVQLLLDMNEVEEETRLELGLPVGYFSYKGSNLDFK